MRLKSVVKYNIHEMKYGILIYYVVIAALMGILAFTHQLNVIKISDESVGFVSGAEASAIFLFVCGLNSFKQNYLYLSTNGITRKAQFYGFLISSVVIAAGMAAIDTVSTNILNIFVDYRPMFYQFYEGFSAESSQLLNAVTDFIWSTVVYLLALVIGYFITTLYYRMSKMLKIIVSVGVPALFMIGSPIMAIYMIEKGYMNKFNSVMAFLGYGNGNPAIAVVITLIETAIIAGLSYLLVRKAPVKE